MIRPLRPTDFLGLVSLRRQAALIEVTSHTWPTVEPSEGRFSPLALVLHSATQPVYRRRAWVLERGSTLDGLLLARVRADGLVWDVERLHARDERAAVGLLEYMAGQAGRAHARRVFVDTPSNGQGADICRRIAFDRYASASLLYLPARSPRPTGERFAARPRLRVDELSLFQLYCAAVPQRVRAAEAMTVEEWSALYRGKRRWAPTVFASREQFVWEVGNWVVGWAELVYGARSQYLEMLLHPDYVHSVDQMLSYALSQTSEKAPVYARAMAHAEALADGMRRAGFGVVADVDLNVKMLAARVPQPKLVPAQVVGV